MRKRVGWLTEAACAGMAVEMFFPPKGGDTKPAKKVCAGCPVRLDCLNAALPHDWPGIFGGKSESERKKLRRSGRTQMFA